MAHCGLSKYYYQLPCQKQDSRQIVFFSAPTSQTELVSGFNGNTAEKVVHVTLGTFPFPASQVPGSKPRPLSEGEVLP